MVYGYLPGAATAKERHPPSTSRVSSATTPVNAPNVAVNLYCPWQPSCQASGQVLEFLPSISRIVFKRDGRCDGRL